MTPEEEAALAQQGQDAFALLASQAPAYAQPAPEGGAPAAPAAAAPAATPVQGTPEEQAAAAAIAQNAAAPAGEPAPAAATPATPDPNAEVLAQLEATQKELEVLKAQLPDDNAKKILSIANAGPEAFEEYMALRNMDYTKMSLLDKLKAEFMSQPGLSAYDPDTRLNIFYDNMKMDLPDFDPVDPDLGYPVGTAGRFRMDQKAADWQKAMEDRRAEKLLQYETPKGPPPFTDEDHERYQTSLADAYTNMKTVGYKDRDGNVIEVDLTAVPEYKDGMENDFLKIGPAAWMQRELFEKDNADRLLINPSKITELVAKVSAIPSLIEKVKADTEARVRAELGEKRKEAVNAVVDETLGIRGKEAPQPKGDDAYSRLMAVRQKELIS